MVKNTLRFINLDDEGWWKMERMLIGESALRNFRDH